MSVGTFLVAVLAFAAPAPGATPPSFGPRHPVAELANQGSVLDLTNADFTGDGIQDVLVLRGRFASSEDFPIAILAGDGRGGFADRTAELFDGPIPRAVWPRQALIADFNGDGRSDFFVGDSGTDAPPFPGHTNLLVLSTPGGKLVDASSQLPPGAVYFHSGAAGDVDGDGDVDIFLADLGTPIRLLLNDGTGHFTTATGRFPASVATYPHDRYTRSALVDVNGDRALDLVLLAENNNPSSAVLVNNGAGSFSELAGALPPKPFGPDSIGITIQPVQLDGDTRPDLLLGYTHGNPWYVGRWIQTVVGNGDGTFRDETATRLPQTDNDRSWPYEFVMGDLDSDGSLDFAVDTGAKFCSPYCSGNPDAAPPFYMNRGDGTFAPLASSAFAEPPFGQLRLIDANLDGRLDVLSVAQDGWYAPERYFVQIQGESGGGGGAPDDDRDGVPNSADACPALAGAGQNGCPGATLKRRAGLRTSRRGKRGIRLDAGVDALCPPAGSTCRGKAVLATVPARAKRGRKQAKPVRLAKASLRVGSGRTLRIRLDLTSRGAAALRKAGKLKVKVEATLTGPDTSRVVFSRTGTIRAPKR